MKRKPYKAKSLAGAQARVRQLLKLQEEAVQLLDRFANERDLLAKLAATGPAFYNPLHAAAASKIRDEILSQRFNMNPDGSPIPTPRPGETT